MLGAGQGCKGELRWGLPVPPCPAGSQYPPLWGPCGPPRAMHPLRVPWYTPVPVCVRG